MAKNQAERFFGDREHRHPMKQKSDVMEITSALRRRARTGRAFTLIETMIALVVMLLSLLGMLAVVPFAFTNVETNSLEVQAVAVGQQFLEDERNATLHSIPAPSATTVPIDAGQSLVDQSVTAKNYGNFTVSPDGCSTVELPASASHGSVASNLCSVSVSWVQSDATRKVTVQSLVTH
jgi:type II secretory pathway pseudopilin PulG